MIYEKPVSAQQALLDRVIAQHTKFLNFLLGRVECGGSVCLDSFFGF